MDASKVISRVAEFCHNRLLSDKEALSYLIEGRGLSKEYIAKFQVGLFPQNLRELFAIIDAKTLRLCNIIKHASESRFQIWDLVLPIRDVYGKYIALAGRTRLSEDDRDKFAIHKYTNSRYNKRYHLFGLNFAKRSIIEKNIVYVVEGYFDVITPHQKGMNNVVAACGSYLSERQLAILSRYTENIVILLDNQDIARQMAQKIVQRQKREGISLTAKYPFPKGIVDIDEYLRKYSVESLIEKLEKKNDYDDIRPLWS